MEICALTPELLTPTFAYLRRSPYRNAMLLSNISQLRQSCDVLVAQHHEEISGVVSTYRDLPIPNFTFAAAYPSVAQLLLEKLRSRNPQLRDRPVMALLPEDRFRHVSSFATLVDSKVEYQMGVEPETLRALDGPPARRLTVADLPTVNDLAEAASLTAWHESMLSLGPAFGCFEGERLVSMAATRFATPDVIEIGNVATHPDFRRRGYAKAATAALVQAAFALAPRVFLMVLEENLAARHAYRALGFQSLETFHLARFLF